MGIKRTTNRILVYLILPAFAAALLWYFIGGEDTLLHCYTDYAAGGRYQCRPLCMKGSFSLPWMESCHKLLRCKEIESTDLKINTLIGGGHVKAVYHATWNDHHVAYNSLMKPKYRPDFDHGLSMIRGLQPSPHVVQLLGYCRDKFVTEYYPFGSADKIYEIFTKYAYLDTLQMRFSLCLNYVEILEFLHTSPLGTRVMCDSNDLRKTLSQYVVTSDLKLKVNDLDALPEVKDETGIKCGPRQIQGDFVAPEQLWPHEDRDFNDKEMRGYNEKTDVWKIPEVCDYFLGNTTGADNLRFHLFSIHKRCKSEAPCERPSAKEVGQVYRDVRENLDLYT